MEAPIRPRKKSAAGKVVFWLFSPVLLAALLAVLLYIALSLFGYPTDNQIALLAETPMGPDARFAFHAAERTVDIAVNPADIAFVIDQGADFDPASLAEPLKDLGLVLESYGVRFDDGAYVTLQLRAFNFVPVPVRLDADVKAGKNGDIDVAVTRVHVTRLFSVSAETVCQQFGVDPGELMFTVEGADLHPRLATLRSVSFSEGNMVLTCGIGEELFREVLEDPLDAMTAGYYVDGIKELSVYSESVYAAGGKRTFGDSFTALLAELEKDPGRIEAVRTNCLALAAAPKAQQAFAGTKGKYLARFLPGVTLEAVTSRHDEIFAVAHEREALLKTLVENLNAMYFEQKISFSDAYLVNRDTGEQLTLPQLVGDFTPYESFLSEKDSRILLCNGRIADLSFGFATKLSKMPREKGATFANVDEKRVHMVLLMTRVKDGTPAFVYLENDGAATRLAIDTITDMTYARLMEAAYLPSASFGGDFPDN